MQPFQPAASHRCLWQSSHLPHSTPATPSHAPQLLFFLLSLGTNFASTFAAVCPISWLRPHANYKCHSNCNKFEYTLRLQQISTLHSLRAAARSRHKRSNVVHLKWLAKCLLAFDWVFLYFIYLFTSLFFCCYFASGSVQLPTMPRAGCDTHLRQTCHKVANGDSVENCQRCISISFALKWKLFIRKGQTEVCNLLRWRLD